MPEKPYGDLGREIDRLWARVSSFSSTETPDFPPSSLNAPAPAGSVAWETIDLLKKQHRHEILYWSDIVEAKEKALQELKLRQGAQESELRSLRQKLSADEGRVIGVELDMQAKLEASLSAINAERAAHEQEIRDLKGILDQTRERMAGEASRWKQEQREWEKKEQQYLLEMKELQDVSQRYQDRSVKASDESRRFGDSLKEAKNALEKTLSELLRERQIRDEAEKERVAAIKKVDDLQRHFEELSKLWEEERGQWRELWDRERSTWEAQRTEFASWEENLRKEREAWHGELKAKEQDQLKFTEHMTEVLRQSTETSSKLAAMMRTLGLVNPPRSQGGKGGPTRRLFWLAMALAAAAAAVPVWKHLNRLQFKVESIHSVDLANPTALTYDGALLWVAEWSGNILALDPEDLHKPVRLARVGSVGAYHPSALSFGGSFLWSADASQARILRHDSARPDIVLASRASPGPAPTALAFDGESLWSYDAANKAVYRHGSDETSYKAFAIEQDMVATAMAWVSGELWIFDSKSRRLLIFTYKENNFKLKDSHALGESILGLAAAGSRGQGGLGRQLWALAGPNAQRAGHALIRYNY